MSRIVIRRWRTNPAQKPGANVRKPPLSDEAAKARADLDVMVEKLHDELRTADDNNKQLADKIKTLSGESSHLTATENHAEFLGEGHALSVITAYSSTAINVTFHNKTEFMKVGNNIPIEFGDRKCRLILTTILNPSPPASADFDLSCKPK